MSAILFRRGQVESTGFSPLSDANTRVSSETTSYISPIGL
jgi:hypothetical protein